MRRSRDTPALMVVAMAACLAGPARAQMDGDMRGGGHHGGHRGQSQNGDKPARSDKGPRPEAEKPVGQIEIIGVVKALDPATDRITIAYEPVEALGWPAGSMPFVAGKSAMLKTVSIGQKVRFKLDSQQISEIKPFAAGPGAGPPDAAPPGAPSNAPPR